MRNHIIFYSGGKSSFSVAHWVKEKYPDDNILLYFTDTLWEHPDLYRFIYEGSDKLKLPMLYHCFGLNPIQLMHKQAVVYNSRIGNCSSILKMGVAADWLKRHKEPKVVKWHNKEYLKREMDTAAEGFAENTTLYFGIGWDEMHREGPIKKNWQPFNVVMPHIEDMIDNTAVLAHYDIEEPELYKLGFTHNNCFSGKERFITIDGIKSFGEMVGQRTKVLGERAHWQDAEIKHFGEQQIVELVIEKKGKERVIETTAGHRWFVRKNRKNQVEKVTSELLSGERLWSLYPSASGSVKPSAIGIAQGIVYGDGTYARNSWNNPATVTLCGEKVELLKYFPLQDVKEVKGVGLKVCDLPKTWKHKPDLKESKSFLLGWLMGYIATDGNVAKGSVGISSSSEEDLIFVQNVCIKIGISFHGITKSDRIGIDGKPGSYYTMRFVKSTFKKEWLLRKKHIEGYGEDTKNRPNEWCVKEVRYTNRVEDVYCAVVPKGARFTLEGNILTGNCFGRCVKAGQGHFINLLQQLPEVFEKTMAYEHHMSQYVSAYHYYRAQHYFPESEQFDGDTLEILMRDLNDAYEDYFYERAPKPKVHVAPRLTATPAEVPRLLMEHVLVGKCENGKWKWQRKKLTKRTWKWLVSDSALQGYRMVETRHLPARRYSYMKRSKGGSTRPYPLRNLYWDAKAEGLHEKPKNVIVQKQKSLQLDLFDVGGCGCDFSETSASACELNLVTN